MEKQAEKTTEATSAQQTNTAHFNYQNYLMLDKIIKAQKPVSDVLDEHLFIVIHQAHELWFLQILVELDYLRGVFQRFSFDETPMQDVVKRLNRIKMILKHNIGKILILETMTPLDFMEFRGKLASASGFQSIQFRMIENKFGLEDEDRNAYGKSYSSDFKYDPEAMAAIENSKVDPLNKVLQRWLEQTPGLETEGFNFWNKFHEVVEKILQEDEKKAAQIPDENDRQNAMKRVQGRREIYDTIFDENKHNDLVIQRFRKFSFKALQGAMFILCYRDEPRFSLPHQILQLLMDIDSSLMEWRYRHSLMVQRQIGTHRIGTQGSTGYGYLSNTCGDNYKVFLDLTNLATFMIPREQLPKLSANMKKVLRETPIATEL